MFALEIEFDQDQRESEMVLVRRPQFSIGSSENCHIVVDNMQAMGFEILVSKDLGRKFRSKPIPVGDTSSVSQLLEGVYDSVASFELDQFSVHIYSLDFDLRLRDAEAPDRASVRVLRQATVLDAPVFPAILVRGGEPFIVSFPPNQPVYIGRSNICAVRIDASEISSKHARMGFESGQFWIEDLGSTNGTFLNGQQISGRVEMPSGIPVNIGRRYSILGVTSEDELVEASNISSEAIPRPSARKYPVVLSTSEVARPARLVLPVDTSIAIGRDPGSDIWLGAPHISRKHCEVTLSKTGSVLVKDSSTNGTGYHGGLIRNGEVVEFRDEPTVLDFGGEITVALCFGDQHETSYLNAGGAVNAFMGEVLENSPEADEADGKTLGGSLVGGTIFGVEDTLTGTSYLYQYFSLFKSLSLTVKLFVVFAVLGLGVIVFIVFGIIQALVF